MLEWIAETTLVAAGLAVVALLTGRLHSIGPTVRHLLWLVVLLKLLTPPVVSWPWATRSQTLDWPVSLSQIATGTSGQRLDDSEQRHVHPGRTEPRSGGVILRDLEPVRPTTGAGLVHVPTNRPASTIRTIRGHDDGVAPNSATTSTRDNREVRCRRLVGPFVCCWPSYRRFALFAFAIGSERPFRPPTSSSTKPAGSVTGSEYRYRNYSWFPTFVCPLLWVPGQAPASRLSRHALSRLSTPAMAGILTHEPAHIRRGDLWGVSPWN